MSIYFLLFATFTMVSCGDDDDERVPGEPSTDFTITILAGNLMQGTADVNWTNSIDPDGTEVVNDLFLDDDLVADNLVARSFVLEGLSPQTEYIIRVVARDENGDTNEATITYTTP